MSAPLGGGCSSRVIVVLYLLLLLYNASDLGLQLLGKIHPYLELEQTSLSNKYSNVPGLWVLECGQKFNAKGEWTFHFNQ